MPTAILRFSVYELVFMLKTNRIMMKIKTFILSCLLAFIAIHANAYDYDFEVDGFKYLITSTADLTLEVAYGPNKDVITIPSTVVFNKRTFRVTGIGSKAFRKHENLTSVDMPSITYISSGGYDIGYNGYMGSFGGCSKLSHVNMPAVTSIGEFAFKNCKALASVSMPAATTIGDFAFEDCEALASVSMPAATSIGGYAFAYCKALASVSMPAATSIGYNAFAYCDALASVSMPAATSIDGEAFKNCKALASVSMPAATTIGHHAFEDCYALESVSMPAATSIDGEAFKNCKALASVSMPAATWIGDAAFYDCDALASVSMPAATTIGYSAFCGCDALASISMPTAISIGKSAFAGCKALASVSMPAAKSIGEKAFGNCKALASVSMPAATSIGDDEFDGCDALASVSMPAATSIASAFYYCKSLSDIYVGAEPASCNSSSFAKVTYATATLHVPAGCTPKYKAADYWKNFAFISDDYDPTGIKCTEVDDVKIHTDNGYVQLNGLKAGERVTFYALDGRTLSTVTAHDGRVSYSAQPGQIVIVKYHSKSAKIFF